MIDTYTVSKSGIASGPTVIPSNGGGPYGFATTQQGYLILTEAGSGSLSWYDVSNTGALMTISGAIPDLGTPGSSTGPALLGGRLQQRAVRLRQQCAHQGPSPSTESRGGDLTLDSSISAHTLIPTLDLTVSSDNQHLYVLNGGQITTFQLYPNGAIAQVSTIALPATASGATGLIAS